jgi:cysteinyl-tRNA synthetase
MCCSMSRRSATTGRLSGVLAEDSLAGARVEVAGYKRDPEDFVLWKPARPTSRVGQPLGARPARLGPPPPPWECTP